jgi:glycerol-3-phosphate acyltransferase PlsY
VLLDFSKGVLAVWLADYFRLKPEPTMLTMLAVASGHIWPMQLWFRGGKGVATSLGAILVFDYVIALVYVGLFLVLFGLVRNFVLAGLLAFAIMPLGLFLAGFPLTSVFGLSALAVLILIAHRKNFREEISKVMSDGKVKSGKRAVSK